MSAVKSTWQVWQLSTRDRKLHMFCAKPRGFTMQRHSPFRSLPPQPSPISGIPTAASRRLHLAADNMTSRAQPSPGGLGLQLQAGVARSSAARETASVLVASWSHRIRALEA
eukprot:354641-Chlamydomonas_euryale.AAC.3